MPGVNVALAERRQVVDLRGRSGSDRDRTDYLRHALVNVALAERREVVDLRGRGGPDRDRTDYLRHAMAALYQVSYGPAEINRC